jgi:hypothetical protein
LPVLQVARRAGAPRRAVWRWPKRYAEAGVEGLQRDKTRRHGRTPVPTATVARVLALTQSEPSGETTHWTGRAMAKAVGLSPRTVQRMPHRIRTFKRSNDPAFAEKVEDVVGLYMHPPAHAVVLSIEIPCVDGPRLARKKDRAEANGLLAVICPAPTRQIPERFKTSPGQLRWLRWLWQ